MRCELLKQVYKRYPIMAVSNPSWTEEKTDQETGEVYHHKADKWCLYELPDNEEEYGTSQFFDTEAKAKAKRRKLVLECIRKHRKYNK